MGVQRSSEHPDSETGLDKLEPPAHSQYCDELNGSSWCHQVRNPHSSLARTGSYHPQERRQAELPCLLR